MPWNEVSIKIQKDRVQRAFRLLSTWKYLEGALSGRE
jgi:hypothetical protein